MNKLLLFKNTYQNKKVLITGNTGFKGSWLSAWLLGLGAKVYGLSNGIPTEPSHFVAAKLADKLEYFEKDVRSFDDVYSIVNKIKPDFVFHFAAQSLVRKSYEDPTLTIQTNVIGTMNVLEALRLANHRCNAVVITSDKCYDNVEWIWGYRETDPLGGKDPYSASKGAAELIIKTYANTFFNEKNSNVKVASARAGNVIGGGDWAKDRIIPDCVRAWSSNKSAVVRNLTSTRPWQHVLEPLSGYLLLGQKISENTALNGEPFNLGPNADQNFTVDELTSEMQKHWPKTSIDHTPDISDSESRYLKLCCDKALHLLRWEANLNFKETVSYTIEWYKKYYSGAEDAFDLTSRQINEYVNLAKERERAWVGNND